MKIEGHVRALTPRCYCESEEELTKIGALGRL